MTKEHKKEIISQIFDIISEISCDNAPTDDNEILSLDKPAAHPIEMLTIKECTQLVHGLSEHSIRKLVYQSKVKHIRAGEGKRGKILINKDDLINYLRG